MYIPEGYTEQQVLDDIYNAVNGLVSNFCFGYYDEDDLRQEGFIFATEALPSFLPDKGCSLKTFLRVCVRNQFINLRRNKLHRNSPPCLSCGFVNSSDKTCCVEFEDKNECAKWSGWYYRNQAKRSLVESCDASKVAHVIPSDDLDVFTHISRAELLQCVSDEIPLELRADYMRLLDGARLSKSKQDAVVASVRSIIGDMLNDDDDQETW